jgi:hypothetical protein
MRTLTVSEHNTDDLILYLESQVLPQLKRGYHSGYVGFPILWDLKGEDEPNPEDEK